jgi:hypothetical protein
MTEYYKNYTIKIEDVGKVKIIGILNSFFTLEQAKQFIDKQDFSVKRIDPTIGNLK